MFEWKMLYVSDKLSDCLEELVETAGLVLPGKVEMGGDPPGPRAFQHLLCGSLFEAADECSAAHSGSTPSKRPSFQMRPSLSPAFM